MPSRLENDARALTIAEQQWGPTFAAITISVLPTLALYLILNKSIIKGLTAGAVKG